MNAPQVYMCSPSWTLLPPPSPHQPTGLSQCTSPKHPVSCIEPGLATRFIYDIIHVSMPFSQIIPPSPSPTESKSLISIFPAILILACASSSPTFHMMCSAYKLNKQGDNNQPWRTPFPIWNQSVVPCPVLTVASWPAYRFLKRQVWCSGIPISWRIFQFVVIHTVKGFGIVNKAEVDVFLELLLFWWSNRCW